jgi:predicted Zn-ribbon and HTH transcriptional regulator
VTPDPSVDILAQVRGMPEAVKRREREWADRMNRLDDMTSNTGASTVKKHTCKRCGYEWEPRKAHPSCCPRCKSYLWDKERKQQERRNG